jgi:Leucine-rich repeat (LRR) protein
LEFNHCKLSELENLIGFKNVVKLRLCDNDLDKKSLLHIIEHFPNLKYLDLSGNKITSDVIILYKKDLKVLVGLKDLTHLIV